MLNVAWFCISRPLITILIKQPETKEFLLGWAADSLYASLPAIAMARSLFFFQAELVNPSCKHRQRRRDWSWRMTEGLLQSLKGWIWARHERRGLELSRQNCRKKGKAGQQASINYKSLNVDWLNRILQSGGVHVAALSLCLDWRMKCRWWGSVHNVPPTLFSQEQNGRLLFQIWSDTGLVTLILGVHLVTVVICEILSLRWLPLPTENGSKLQLEWCVGAYSYKYNSNSSLKMAAARIWGQSDKLFHRSRSYVYILNSDFRWTQRSCFFFANEYLKLVSNSIH